MNKAIFIVIGLVVIVAAIFAWREFYTPKEQPAPQPIATPSVLDRIEEAVRAKLEK